MQFKGVTHDCLIFCDLRIKWHMLGIMRINRKIDMLLSCVCSVGLIHETCVNMGVNSE